MGQTCFIVIIIAPPPHHHHFSELESWILSRSVHPEHIGLLTIRERQLALPFSLLHHWVIFRFFQHLASGNLLQAFFS